jgi:dsRNA-specific ribonuclease
MNDEDQSNAKNNEITLNNVQSILTNYGLGNYVHNIGLYRRAFIHKSYIRQPNNPINNEYKTSIPLKQLSNERLEFLGDGVLELITKYYLYRRFPKENEGFMTEKKIALVNNESLGRLAYKMNLHKWFILSKHSEDQNTRTNLKKLGCLFESFLGAVFLDYNKLDGIDGMTDLSMYSTGPGFQATQVFVESIFEKHVDWIELIRNDNNYKNILQVKIQKIFKTTPDYIEISRTVEQGYNVGVYLCLGQSIHNVKNISASEFYIYNNSLICIQEAVDKYSVVFVCMGIGIHKQKKKAEQLACKEALDRISSGSL